MIILVECPLSTFLSYIPCGKVAKNPQEDYVEAAINQVLEIHMTYPPGDILVFMTGQEDIETTCEVLADRCNQLAKRTPRYALG